MRNHHELVTAVSANLPLLVAAGTLALADLGVRLGSALRTVSSKR